MENTFQAFQRQCNVIMLTISLQLTHTFHYLVYRRFQLGLSTSIPTVHPQLAVNDEYEVNKYMHAHIQTSHQYSRQVAIFSLVSKVPAVLDPMILSCSQRALYNIPSIFGTSNKRQYYYAHAQLLTTKHLQKQNMLAKNKYNLTSKVNMFLALHQQR